MSGPCMCGDPYCASCGSPGLAEIEEACDWATEQFAKGKLSASEIRTCVLSGMSTVTLLREAIKQALADERDATRLGL